MSEDDGLNSKLTDYRTIFFQGWNSHVKDGKKIRREIVSISDNDLGHDDFKLDDKERTLVEILEASRDYLRAESIYNDETGIGSTTGASKHLYIVLGSSGKYANIKYVEIEFRKDLTRRIRLM